MVVGFAIRVHSAERADRGDGVIGGAEIEQVVVGGTGGGETIDRPADQSRRLPAVEPDQEDVLAQHVSELHARDVEHYPGLAGLYAPGHPSTEVVA